MKDVLSPKELAAAIGVSESSLRRWVDSGAFKTSRTVGGHRRIPLAEAVRFIRESHANVVRPELLGFAPLTTPPAGPPDSDAEAERLYQALLNGDAALARGIIVSLYLTGSSVASLFDGPLASCMHRVGELWRHAPRGVLAEHRATDIVVQIVSQLRQLLPAPGGSAPLAIGGAPTDDVYLLPSQMAAATLADVGYAVQNIGPNTPLATLALGADELRAKVVYLSVTSATGVERLSADDLYAFAEQLAKVDATLLVGGQQLPRMNLTPRANLQIVGSMTELATFARGLLAPEPAAI